MALHSLPEGLAIGAGEHLGISLLLGIVFFLHFVPEGLAIAVPMRASGTKVWKILLLCAAAGLPAVFGGIIAYYVVAASAVLLSYSLAFASGAMLYVALSEMLPTAYKYSDRYKLISAITLAGAFLIIMFSFVL
jgi:ZIP family zinc transporter